MRHKSNVDEVFPSPRVFTQPRDLLDDVFMLQLEREENDGSLCHYDNSIATGKPVILIRGVTYALELLIFRLHNGDKLPIHPSMIEMSDSVVRKDSRMDWEDGWAKGLNVDGSIFALNWAARVFGGPRAADWPSSSCWIGQFTI